MAGKRETDFEDDEDRYDYDDEDEDDENPHSSAPKKKKRKKSNTLIDIEAEEDDADDEDEDDEHGVNDLIADEDEAAEIDGNREQIRAQRYETDRARKDLDLEQYFRKRFENENYADDDDDVEAGAPDTRGIDQQSLLPTIRDPRIWIVKCRRPGHERRAIFSLLQKMFNLRRKGVEIRIFSAVAPEHLKGTIYIEAFSAAEVEFAINGLDLFSAYDGIKALKLEEMTDVLKVGKRPEKQIPGNWVRMTRGIYKGDLAQVVDIRESGSEGQIMVRMIPRLDLKGEKEYLEDLDRDEFPDNKGKNSGPRRKGRPPQQLFDKNEVARLTGTADIYEQRYRETGEIYDVWNGEMYRYGLLYRRVSVKTLVTGDAVNTQVDELDKWIAAETRMKMTLDEDATAMELAEASRGLGLNLKAISGTQGAKLFKGDSVRVVSGEQKGLTGTIASIDGDVVLMRTAEFPEPLRVKRSDLAKTFSVGDHIKVSSGKKAGYAGAIVRVDGDVLTIFTDTTREEINVLTSQVADSSDIHTEVGSRTRGALQTRMQFELFDLVQMVSDHSEKGVVIQVRNEGLSILTAQNEVRDVPVGAVKGKLRDMSSRALDDRGNPIAPNDTIHVISGRFKDRQGIVKHVAGNTVFFKARDEVKNCGILAVVSHECRASTAAARRITSTLKQAANADKNPAPRPRGSIGSYGNGGMAKGLGGGGGKGSNRDELLYKDVKIRSGQYKGYKGRVVDTTETTARIELFSKMKTITLPKGKVRRLDEPASNGPSRGPAPEKGERLSVPQTASLAGSRTPRHSSHLQTQTPRRDDMYRNQTPRVDRFSAQTPRHGAATPRVGMTPFMASTPGRDDFRPTRTPGRDDFSGSLGGVYGRTPLPHTPLPAEANPYTPMTHHLPQTPATPAVTGMPATPMGGGFAPVEPRTPATIVEPSTPGYGGLEPRTPAPGMEPTTPAPGIEPRTPAPSHEPRTPAPGHEPRTPAPGMEPATPMVQDANTPHTPGMIPQTPGVPDEEPATLGYQVLVNVEVLVASENSASGVVIDASNDGTMTTIRMLSGESQDKTVQVPVADLTPVQPRAGVGETQELVKVLDGPYAGRTGRLESAIESDDRLMGTLRFTNGEVSVLDMSFVAKCYER